MASKPSCFTGPAASRPGFCAGPGLWTPPCLAPAKPRPRCVINHLPQGDSKLGQGQVLGHQELGPVQGGQGLLLLVALHNHLQRGDDAGGGRQGLGGSGTTLAGVPREAEPWSSELSHKVFSKDSRGLSAGCKESRAQPLPGSCWDILSGSLSLRASWWLWKRKEGGISAARPGVSALLLPPVPSNLPRLFLCLNG